ncbi:MAG: GTP 3',8-cyclase MoaA [Treponema sp.]|jgi:cyclic pyranopterin phosphate synthase|nr:GTP 3',8-cyclase MoaA [Treponema sp.]
MQDSLGRQIDYLRLSLTGRCNLACIYCRGGAGDTEWPDAGEPGGGQDGELSMGEIKRIIPCTTALGIRKVRLTGGEPLLREDLEEIVAYLGSVPEIQDLAMTTNGQGLARRAAALKKAGLGRVNISLDSLKPGVYREITRGGDLEETLAGVRAALAWGLEPVKLNCVILKGRNDGEAGAFIALAREQPLHVRFIELMPFRTAAGIASAGMTSAEILETHGELRRLEPETGPVETAYAGKGFRGTVGFISPISQPFCRNCNRIRITADGKLKTCLGHNRELDLRSLLTGPDTALRSAVAESAIAKSAIAEEIARKPGGHHFGEGFVSQRTMDRIGG